MQPFGSKLVLSAVFAISFLFALSDPVAGVEASPENPAGKPPVSPPVVPPTVPPTEPPVVPPVIPPPIPEPPPPPNDCPFSKKTSQYQGTPLEQARCLLRKIYVRGIVSTEIIPLPAFLEDNVGKPIKLTKAKVKAHLASKSISLATVGGVLDGGLSQNEAGKLANYFVIHDTSDELEGTAFPPEMDDPKWPPNRLGGRDKHKSHLFINRVGASAAGNFYSESVRATKMEKKEPSLEGLFLHHELVQPRVVGEYRYAAVAPIPGFTVPQLKRLALMYVVASVRKGTWMIPAFHCVIDTEIPGGHDDPQNFDLPLWVGLIEEVVKEISSI